MLISMQPVEGDCSSLDSRLLATAIEVSKTHHNLTINQNSPIIILFQHDIALSLHYMFHLLIFSNCGENANGYITVINPLSTMGILFYYAH